MEVVENDSAIITTPYPQVQSSMKTYYVPSVIILLLFLLCHEVYMFYLNGVESYWEMLIGHISSSYQYKSIIIDASRALQMSVARQYCYHWAI